MSSGSDFERLGDLVRQVVGEGSPDPDPAQQLAAVWQEVVGAEVAANARPVQLRQGRLVVSTSSAPWAQTLQLMSGAIVARLNERLGPGSVERAVFRHAGWEGQARPRLGVSSGVAEPAGTPGVAATGESLPSPQPLTREQEEALAVVESLELPPQLRAGMTRAIRAAFVRAEQDSVR